MLQQGVFNIEAANAHKEMVKSIILSMRDLREQ
jgi:hypothetical protein